MSFIPKFLHRVGSPWFLTSSLDIDYDEDYDCEAFGCDSICRCRTISINKVDSVNIVGIITGLFDAINNCKIVLSPIEAYCLERIFNKYLSSTHAYDVEVMGDYYGDELIANFNQEIIKEIDIQFDKITSFDSDIEKIFLILGIEYGYLSPKVRQCTKVTIQDISLKEIKPQTELRKEVETRKLLPSFPLGVLTKVGEDSYRIVDGHHRYRNALKQKHSKGTYIILE